MMSVEIASNSGMALFALYAVIVLLAAVAVFVILRSSDEYFRILLISIVMVVIIMVMTMGTGIINQPSSVLAQKTLETMEETYGVTLAVPVSQSVEDLRGTTTSVMIAFPGDNQNPVMGSIIVDEDRATLFVNEDDGVLTPAGSFSASQ